MAKKNKTVFVCRECGYETLKWQGQCICGAWNSFYEEKLKPPVENDKRNMAKFVEGRNVIKPVSMASVVVDADSERIDTGIGELNRVLGGGVVKGSLTLLSGEPGIGKSTIILQTANNIASSANKVLYVSGEESQEQLKLRANRICGKAARSLYVMAETEIENIITCAEEIGADFLIIDSIQTMYSSDLDSAPGSVSQVRECGNELMRFAKMKAIPAFIVAHVTKTGELAGPKIVEHLVDCVIHFSGERNKELRILRAFKNRFGTTSEIGAFQMENGGLREVENLSEAFLGEDGVEKEGSVRGAVYEGSRPLLIEVQALTARSNLNFPRRNCIGIDSNRLSMILAVMERKCGLILYEQDVFVNVVGGLKPEGTHMDLSVALAIYSSFRSVKPIEGTIAIGELGLTGEVRNVRNIDRIVKEAERMGFKRIIIPETKTVPTNSEPDKKIEILKVDSIRAAINFCFS